MIGTERRRVPWKLTLHDALLDEFRRLRAIVVKINNKILKDATFNLLANESKPATAQDIVNATRKLIYQLIDSRFVRDFSNSFNITYCIRAVKNSLKPEVVQELNKRVEYDLGRLRYAFLNGLNESDVSNYDEAHIRIDMDDGKVLKFWDTKRPRYQKISSSGISSL